MVDGGDGFADQGEDLGVGGDLEGRGDLLADRAVRYACKLKAKAATTRGRAEGRRGGCSYVGAREVLASDLY